MAEQNKMNPVYNSGNFMSKGMNVKKTDTEKGVVERGSDLRIKKGKKGKK